MRKTAIRGFHSGPHQHPFYELGVVLSGQCVWTLEGRKKMVLTRGELLLLPPQTTHQEDAEGNAEGRVMWVGFEIPGRDLSHICLKKLETVEIETLENLLRWIEAEWNSTEAGSSSLSTKAMEMILILLERSALGTRSGARKKESGLNERQSRIVRAARSYFEQNPGIPRSVEQIARYHSLSVSHFSALFRQGLGVGPREFVQKLRLTQTGKLLRESDLSLKEIAVRYGYVDAAHFCRHFKKGTGLTPGQFRKKRRGGMRNQATSAMRS